ncbi:hypothetical protein VOI54_16440 [Tamlana sp. 2201CG12-4]|uniref:hypothetical protein n=1 Tax=Tamlana sp. 2201CG12-4 TaxID=3112582 RepID=UPI002DBDC137|nr:hypothetical protein [Tamlana sp. 2201CG12-4]MEC3908619.1 hypothetical protein [Tamlana sp. 2201CG12-4]
MEIDILGWIGYIASGVIAVSMMMNSIVKFRWINLIGAGTFAIYGLLINALPVFVLNGFIVSVDIYFLFRIYTKSHLFDTLEIRGDNKYLLKFINYHQDEIQKFFPDFVYKPKMNTVSFFVLRNMAVTGLFLAHRENENTLNVGLDYVIPEYRDHKNGKYVYHRLKERFIKEGYKKVVSKSSASKHIKYLKKIGFEEKSDNLFVKEL